MRILKLLVILASISLNGPADAASIVAAGYSSPTTINVAPGQVVTFFMSGIGASLTGPVRASTEPLPTSLAGISATFVHYGVGYQLRMMAVEPVATCLDAAKPGCSSYAAITAQIPFEIQSYCPGMNIGVFIPAGQVLFAENGTVVVTVDAYPLCNNIHLLRTCDLLLPNHTLSCDPVVTHADGSMVTGLAPAHAGEEIVIYAVGLGFAEVRVGLTGRAPTYPIPIPTGIGFDFRPNAGPSRPSIGLLGGGFRPALSPAFSGMTPGFVGLYQINVVIPPPPDGLPACDVRIPGPFITSNLTVNVVGVGGSFDGVGICVQPGS